MPLKAFICQVCHKSFDRQCYDVSPVSVQGLPSGQSHPSLINTLLVLYSLGGSDWVKCTMCLGYSHRASQRDRLMVILWNVLNFNFNKLITILKQVISLDLSVL